MTLGRECMTVGREPSSIFCSRGHRGSHDAQTQRFSAGRRAVPIVVDPLHLDTRVASVLLFVYVAYLVLFVYVVAYDFMTPLDADAAPLNAGPLDAGLSPSSSIPSTWTCCQHQCFSARL